MSDSLKYHFTASTAPAAQAGGTRTPGTVAPQLEAKLARLKSILAATGGCAVAFSGGVDSSLLLAVAREVLRERCLAVIATSSTYSRREYREAVAFAEDRGIPLATISSEELEIPGFRDNPPDRCYHCKTELFSRIAALAAERGLRSVADGSNSDDLGDYRPGMRAARELGVISPLQEAGLGKEEIRALSRRYALPTAEKPAMACLASRFPYGSTITREKLGQVEAMEEHLRELGFSGFRARHHGDLVRLEVPAAQLPALLGEEVRQSCLLKARELGFTYTTVDLEGYRTGSMNEALPGAASLRR